jgi:hypothetical protein
VNRKVGSNADIYVSGSRAGRRRAAALIAGRRNARQHSRGRAGRRLRPADPNVFAKQSQLIDFSYPKDTYGLPVSV